MLTKEKAELGYKLFGVLPTCALLKEAEDNGNKIDENILIGVLKRNTKNFSIIHNKLLLEKNGYQNDSQIKSEIEAFKALINSDTPLKNENLLNLQ